MDNAEELQAVLHGETTPYRVRLADRYWDLTAAPADYRRFL
ncbi:hypothetical protein [Corynebacterium yudongzhengii]|nr:hypothetical protein [Corynebacterium yudongzhengii]